MDPDTYGKAWCWKNYCALFLLAGQEFLIVMNSLDNMMQTGV